MANIFSAPSTGPIPKASDLPGDTCRPCISFAPALISAVMTDDQHNPQPTPAVFEKVKVFLDTAGVDYKLVQHAPTFTSAESAEARGEDLANGGKALLMKVGDDFALFVMSAALRLDSKKVRRHLGEKRSRFASKDELFERTGLEPGSVPPFGEPILPFPLSVDVSIEKNERIAFNAGSLTDSIIMSVQDYLRLTKPDIFEFAYEMDLTSESS